MSNSKSSIRNIYIASVLVAETFANEGAAKAFKQSRAAMTEQTKKLGHPEYWLLFVLVSKGTASVLSQK